MKAPVQAQNDVDALKTETARTAGQDSRFVDKRPAMVAQRELTEMLNDSPRVLQQRALSNAIHTTQLKTAQYQTLNALFDGAVRLQGDGAISAELSPAQCEEKTNNTGLPNQLKAGIESLSGMSMDHVRVHYNSANPAQLHAHAYAQGDEIHLGPSQEKHLPHEAWHVVQQAQGRVRPTLQMKAGAVNDDPSLEKEADMMGEKAAQFKGDYDVRKVAEERVATQRVAGFINAATLSSEQAVAAEAGSDLSRQAAQGKLIEKIDSGARQLREKHVVEMAFSKNVPAQLQIMDEKGEKITDEVLQDLLKQYPTDVQEILQELHNIEEGGWSIEEAFDLAHSKLAGSDEEESMPVEARPTPPSSSIFRALMEGDQASDSDDSEYVDDEPSAASAKARVKKQKPQKGSFMTTDTFKGQPSRPANEPVKIDREKVSHASGMYRTKNVSGLVRPTATTGRPSAPEPDAGPKVAVKWKAVGVTQTRDTGIVDAQKGHIMALELGGPDIAENIVAQWAMFQSNGEWREAEKKVLQRALEEDKVGNRVHFQCDVQYKSYENVASGTQQGVFMPSGFRMWIAIKDKSGKKIGNDEEMFNGQQAQDKTDDKLRERVFEALEKIEAQGAADGIGDSDEDNSSEGLSSEDESNDGGDM